MPDLKTVEDFFKRLGTLKTPNGGGNITIQFIGNPTTFNITVCLTENKRVSGSGSSLSNALEALVVSIGRL